MGSLYRASTSLAVVMTFALSCQPEFIENTRPCEYSQSDGNSGHPKKNIYQDLIDEYTGKGLPGIILLVSDKDGTWTGASGSADIENRVPMSPCHISKVASITKMFVATVAMQLVEEDVLSLDGLVSAWLPTEVVDRIENLDSTTLRQLLNHTSGIYDVIDDNSFYLDILNNPTKRRTLAEVAEFAYDKPAAFEVGRTVGYSNTNTLLVSMILERVSGRPHQQLIRERITMPLGLLNTYYVDFDKLPQRTAQGYFDLFNNNTLVNLSNYNTAIGYGGMYSSVQDLKVFIEALLIEGTLLKQESIDEMMQFHPLVENGKLLGAGIFKDFIALGEEKYAYGHRGRDLAYTADMFWFPNQNTIMVMFLNYGTDADSRLRPVFYEFRDELGRIITQ